MHLSPSFLKIVFTGFLPQASTVISGQGSSVQQTPLAAPTSVLPSQGTANPQGNSGIQGAASSTDSKFSGRKELPAVRHT